MEFKIGDIVCLTFDKSKRFLVASNIQIKGKIQLKYFDEDKHEVAFCEIEPQYLTPAPTQD